MTGIITRRNPEAGEWKKDTGEDIIPVPKSGRDE